MWYLYKKEVLHCICCSVFSTRKALFEHMIENNLSFEEYGYFYRR